MSFGRIHPEISKEAVFVCEININKLQEIKTGGVKYKEISKFPSIKKDIALVVDKNIEARITFKSYKKSLW